MNRLFLIGLLGLILINCGSNTENKTNSESSDRHELVGVYLATNDTPAGEKYMLTIIQNNGEMHSYYKVDNGRVGDYNNWKIEDDKFCVDQRKGWMCFNYTIDRDRVNLRAANSTFEMDMIRIYEE